MYEFPSSLLSSGWVAWRLSRLKEHTVVVPWESKSLFAEE